MPTERGEEERIIGRPEVSRVRRDGHTIFFPESDHGDRRLLSYVALTCVLLAGGFLAHRFEYRADLELHVVLEAIAVVLAVVIGSLALVRFYSRKLSTYLFLGTGFLAAAFLDGYHAVVTSPFVASPSDPDLPDLTAWTWIASRVFLSLFLFVSWLVWYQEERDRGPKGSRPVEARSVYFTAAVLTLLTFVFFSRSPLSEAYHPERLLSRPGEFVPGLFFSLALVGFLTKGDWRRDTFEHWLVVALITSVATHLGFLIFSQQQHDLLAVAAHALKIVSYLAVLTGLMASVFITFRREGEASAAILEANQALAYEIKVRGRAERVLQESEERLQDFLDNATDLIQSTDPSGRVIYVNQAWKRTLGYSEEELEDLNILSVVHPDSREDFRQIIRRVFQGEALSDFEVVFQTKSGRSVTCAGSSNCRFEGGRPVATRSILRNVTEQRRAEEELARSQANVQALFESTGDAIWSVGRDRRLITFNTAFALTVEATSGRAPQGGDAPPKVMPGESVAWFRDCYDRALAGTRFSAVREEDLDGQGRVYELFFNPIDGEDGIEGVVVFSKDITRRRSVEEALRSAKLEAEEANQAKSQFMANMSHELRTPLNSVIGFANILLKKGGDGMAEKERGFLERILANGKHLLALINEILDLSKIEAGRMEVELESVDLKALIAETLAQMEGQVAGKPVALRSEIEGDPSPFLTDPGKVKQILINLAGNALKFTEEGEVVVRVECAPDGQTPERIQVRDTGIGIPDDRLEAIFEAFQQADGTTTRRFGGTGLGLTISRSLCALMGYRITVDSTVGEGSTFTIHVGSGSGAVERTEGGLSALEGAPKPRWAPRLGLAADQLDGKTVLVVDDQADSRSLLTHYLEDIGCHVRTAVDGVDGLEVARRERPDLVTVDLMMPRMGGWEMLRAMKEDPALRNVPTVVVSVAADEGTGQFLGAVDLLGKPFDREDLLQVVQRNLATERGRVLVVEDDPDIRRLLQRYLHDAGVQPHAVANGQAALEFLKQSRVDLVLLDLLMPTMDGFATLKQIRQDPHTRTTPVIILTAKDLSRREAETLAADASGVILKNEEVEDRLREVLAHYFERPSDDGTLEQNTEVGGEETDPVDEGP